ncbi:MAG: hypothetical protein E4H08_09455 [Candidatus Atribacteria bacterium]|nr:MAG: hypothetical protein E4H08_09455 [Candidatus Atribacteria bacterium]
MNDTTGSARSRLIVQLFIPLLFVSIACGPVAWASECPDCRNMGLSVAHMCYVRNTATDETLVLPIQRMTLETELSPGNRLIETRYVVDIPSTLERSSSNSESRVDQTISYRLTLTQYFNQLYLEGYWWVSVSQYRGVWQRLDYQVAAKDAYLVAWVNSHNVLGGGTIDEWEETSHFVPGSYASKTITPGWAGTYVRVSAMEWQCGLISAVFYRRNEPSETWELWFSVCEGSWPWSW